MDKLKKIELGVKIDPRVHDIYKSDYFIIKKLKLSHKIKLIIIKT